MRMRHAAVVAGLALGLMSGAAEAASFTVTYSQTDLGVVAIAAGDFAIDQLKLSNGSAFTGATVQPNASFFSFGNGMGSQYRGSFTGPSSFGPGGALQATTDHGDVFEFNYLFQYITVPQGYVSGQLEGMQQYAGATINSLGLTPGTFTWDYGGLSEEPLLLRADLIDPFASTITVQVGPTVSTVPLPASARMFGAALLGLAGFGYAARAFSSQIASYPAAAK